MNVLDSIRKAAKEFLQLQRVHAENLRDGRLDAIFGWQEERRHAFIGLRTALRQAMAERKNTGIEEALRDILSAVLAGERQLAVAAAARREELAGILARIRQGRRCLNGYRWKSGTEPRVLQGRT